MKTLKEIIVFLGTAILIGFLMICVLEFWVWFIKFAVAL